jgi:hypothetical protein
MSQTYNDRKSRRTSRAQRNRPVLVTSTETTVDNQDIQNEQSVQEITPEEISPVPDTPSPASTERRARRIPGFFSTIGKRDQDGSTTGETVVKARLSRATRGQVTSPSVASAPESTESKEAAQSSQVKKTTQTTSKTPPSAFKTRYILGLAIYVFGAEFLGNAEQTGLRALKLESLLTTLNLFGLQFPVYVSTLCLVATLFLMLILLVRFDLFPKSFSAAGNASMRGSGQSQNRSSSESRPAQPTMRQGVQGDDDDLYQQYRANQRREKKR